MSNILVVQPHRALQHAFVIALFPEHHVQLTDKIPEAESAAKADLVIIDAGALRRRRPLTGEDLSRIQSWRVPIIWLDDEALGGASKVVHLTPPLNREQLRTAVTDCLRSSSPRRPAPVPATTRAKSLTTAADTMADEKEVIELVDVFEESSGPEEANMDASNKE